MPSGPALRDRVAPKGDAGDGTDTVLGLEDDYVLGLWFINRILSTTRRRCSPLQQDPGEQAQDLLAGRASQALFAARLSLSAETQASRRTERPCPSPPRSATSPSSATAGRGRRHSSRRSSSRRARSTASGRWRPERPSPTRPTTSTSASSPSRCRSSTPSGRTARSTSSTFPAIRRSRASCAAPRASSRARSSRSRR